MNRQQQVLKEMPKDQEKKKTEVKRKEILLESKKDRKKSND